jgi:outer membrane protein TolC
MIRFSIVIIVAAWVRPAAAQAPLVLSFTDAVGAAERAAESVAVARAEVDRAEALVSGAMGAYLPDIAGTASYQRTLASQFDNIDFGGGMGTTAGDALPFGQPNNWNLGVRITQPLFDGLRTQNLTEQARAALRASKLGVQSSRAQAVQIVAQAYFDAVLAQRQVEIAEVTFQEAEKTFNEATLGFQQGSAPEFDVVRAEVARDNQRTLVVQFKVQRDVTLVLLRRLIGVKVDRPITLTTGLDADDVAEVAEAARVAAGVEKRIGSLAVAQARESVAANEAAVSAARAAYYPTIVAVSDLGVVNYQRQPFNTDWFTNWTVGVNLSIPIFDQFRRRTQIRQDKAVLAGARAQLQQADEVSQVETAQAAAAVASSTTQLENGARTVKQAKRAYEIAELRFQQGASTHLELVDARVQLEQALLVVAKAARDLRLARVREELLPALPLGLGLETRSP